MKNNQLIIAAVFGILFFGCSKTEQPSPEKVVRPQQIRLHTMAGMEFARPEVPVYFGDDAVESRGVTTVSPGTNQLQAIINNAANNETIRLLPGTHTEDATLVINHKVKLTGDAGAVLSLSGFIGLLVSGSNGTQVTGLDIVNGGGSLIGIGVENSNQVQIKGNAISGIAFAVVLEQANHVKVLDNTIVGTGAGHGVVVINGDFANVSSNIISNGFFGIWACDRNGTCVNNNVQNNVIGIIACNVPPGEFPIGNGTGGAEMPANNWNISNNYASGNVWGYMVIDGSFENTLSNNATGGNVIDMELVGPTTVLFSPLVTPTSHDNTVNVGGSGLDVIDCGVDNVVHGTTPLAGPCSI